MAEAVAAESYTVALTPGIYTVKVGTETFKVAAR